MKRALRLLAVVAVLGLVAAACSSKNNASPGASSSGGGVKGQFKIGMVYDLAGRGDHSFNDSAYNGLQSAKTDFINPSIEVKDLTPASTGKNRQPLMRLLAQSGYQLIFGNGFAFEDDLKAVAKDFPSIKFVCTDCGITQPDGKPLPPTSNILNMDFAANQGSYLVGAAAALKSGNGHIGFIGGVDVPLIHDFQAGYEAGAKKINPNIKIDVKYLTAPPNFAGFDDPAAGKEAALGMFQGGADVVYHAAGGSGAGLFAAAEEYSKANNTHVWAIGVDGDQYSSSPADEQPYILTSMIKNVGSGVHDTIQTFISGQFQGGSKVYTLADGGINYSTSGGFVNDIATQLTALRQQIILGTITVPTGSG